MIRKVNKNIEKIASIFFCSFLLGLSSESMAQVSYSCSRNTNLSPYDWQMATPGGTYYDGQVIGTAFANSVFYYSGVESKAFVEGGARSSLSYRFNAVPMPKTPGVGVRISWRGHWVHGGYSFKVDQQRPDGTQLTAPYWYSLLSGSAPAGFNITYQFKYEIVVIDADKYKGGKPNFTRAADIRASVFSNHINGGRRQCVQGDLDLLEPLINDASIPDLPRPPIPTCASADLNMVATLPPVTVAQVAPQGSARSRGMTGEYRFDLVGRQCPLGTKISAYFTDARAPTADNNYVTSSHPSVAVRLYHRDSSTPIKLGPAPVGSTQPSRLAVVEGPSTSAMSDMRMPMTAQYVAMPGVDLTTIKPGNLQAEAVVTFMYD